MSPSPAPSSPSPFHREPARADDLPAIVEIYNSTVAGRMVTADLEPVPVESRRAWFEAHAKPQRPLWVVRDPQAGGLAGWLSFSDFYGRPAYRHTAEVSIYLREDWRGRGLGRWLLREAIAHAPAIEVSTLLGFVFGHNGPSMALFASEGFEAWGTYPRVAVLDGVERDLVVLGRRVA